MRHPIFRIFLIVLLLESTGICLGREPRQDPVTGKVRVFYIGKYFWRLERLTPIPFLRNEPLFTVRGMPGDLGWYEQTFPQAYNDPYMSTDKIRANARRFMRRYLPRSYALLTNSTDVIILSDVSVDLFEPKRLNWFSDAVVKNGLGLAMIGGENSFGGNLLQGKPWTGTTVADILPVECILQPDPNYPDVLEAYSSATGSVEIVNHDNKFIISLPWDTLVPPMNNFIRFNNLKLKKGANLLANLRVGTLRSPFLVTWDQGEGRTFAMGADWDMCGGVYQQGVEIVWGGVHFAKWEYYGDFASNLVLYTAGVSIPADRETRHAYKIRVNDYWKERSLLIDTLNFVEKFGANTVPLTKRLGENDQNRKQAERLYIQQDFAAAVSLLNQTIARNYEIADKAIEAKNRVFLWIWAIEYLVVTATFLIAGVVTWTLMVRRRLYRETGLTRDIHT